jgi:membrane fusion protein, multidrug efflux system
MTPLRSSPRSKLCALGLAALLAAPGCARERRVTAAEAGKPVRARVVGVEKREMRRDVSAVGSLYAYDEVTVSSEIEGRVERVLADVGDRVKRAQPLVRVSPVELELARDQQQAALQQIRAQLGVPPGAEDVRDPRQAAEAQRAAADLGDAELKYRRAKSLFDDGLIARGAFDEAEARYNSAKAAYEIALQSVGNLRAQLKARQSALALAEKKLSDSVIRAPFAGEVKERQVVQGQYLRVQTPVMVIVDVDPLRVRLRVPERVAGWIAVGQGVKVEVEAYPGKSFEGRLARLNPSVDTQTRTLEVEALLDNHAGLLKPGFFAKATIASSQVESALLLPNDAVRYVFGVYKVFAVEGRTLKEKEVKLGDRSGPDVEIVSGLGEHERVAVPLEGQDPRDGAPVEPVS